MKVAILIGVVEFDSYSNLNGCKNDVDAVKDIIEASKNFDEIKVYDNRVESAVIKDSLRLLFEDLHEKNVDELFFYFTGHGSFFRDEFYYILSDYDEDKRRQTSLQNSEIDTLIKSISPEIVVKVIDACESGVSYVKGDSKAKAIEKHYNDTKDEFKKCYFLHSSLTTQASYQNSNISDFTKSFLSAIETNENSKIRYKDIIDYISDDFEKRTDQTPFFVAQGAFTETFLNSSEEIKRIIQKYIGKSSSTANENKDSTIYNSFIEKIQKDAEDYASEEEVLGLLHKIQTNLESKKLNSDMSQLFDLEVIFEYSLDDLPKSKAIVNWLNDNKHDYFTSFTYDIETYEENVPVNVFGTFFEMMKEPKKVTKQRSVLSGYDLTVDVPYKSILINLNPKYPNISKHACLIAFVISPKIATFFSSQTSYIPLSWTKKIIKADFKWVTHSFLAKEESNIVTYINDVFDDYCKQILSYLEKKFKVIQLEEIEE